MARSALSLFALSTAAVALIAGAAHAGGFNVRSQSAVGNGMAHAGAGTSAWGASSMFWNPAAITAVPGRQSEVNASYVMPYANIQIAPPVGPNSGDVIADKFVPSTYNTWQINDRFWIGMNTGSAYGSESSLPVGFPLRPANVNTEIFSLAATPMVGVKLNDFISVGAGIVLQYTDVSARNLVGGAPVTIGGDAFSVGFTAGVNITPWQGGSIGVGFRSGMDVSLDGHLTSPLGRFGVDANLPLPSTLSVGLRQELNDRLAVSASAQWTDWSTLQTVPVRFDVNGVTAATIDFRYRDEYMFALGAEYKFTPELTVRAGAAYEISPVTNNNRGVTIVDANRVWLSAGVGYKVSDKLSFDVSYSHLFLERGRLSPQFQALVGPTRTEGSANIISAAVRYRWDSPENAEGVITK